MQPRKLKVGVARFPYGGNGGTASEVPEVGTWLAKVAVKVSQDPRIEWEWMPTFSDTPIPMTRNLSVEYARQRKFDVLVMIDSDMVPDCEIGRDPNAKPFFSSSFDFLYEHYERGPVVIAAPYCGPPPNENVYVFQWVNRETGRLDDDSFALAIDQFSRPEAARRSGFEAAAALPTGLIMYDMRVFDIAPSPYFYYEYDGDGAKCPECGCRKPGKQHKKASTEDCTATRDFALIGQQVLGYNPMFVNWDAWAGHMKPKMVRKPVIMGVDGVGERFTAAMKRNERSDEKLMIVGAGDGPKRTREAIPVGFASSCGPTDLIGAAADESG